MMFSKEGRDWMMRLSFRINMKKSFQIKYMWTFTRELMIRNRITQLLMDVDHPSMILPLRTPSHLRLDLRKHQKVLKIKLIWRWKECIWRIKTIFLDQEGHLEG